MAHGRTTIGDLVKVIESDRGYTHSRDRYFRDMVEVWTLALRNGVEPRNQAWDAREALYMEHVARYGRETMDVFSRVMGELVLMAGRSPSDHVGELNMALELGRKGSGQFFTPYHVSRFMAAMACDGTAISQAVEEKGWLSLSEPACGSGGMIVAVAEEMRQRGYDPSRQLRVVAQDIDLHCVNMCYVQMRLHRIPAAVIHGDTLKLEERSVILTPEYVLQDRPHN